LIGLDNLDSSLAWRLHVQSNPGSCNGEPGTIETFIDGLPTGAEPVLHIGKQTTRRGAFSWMNIVVAQPISFGMPPLWRWVVVGS